MIVTSYRLFFDVMARVDVVIPAFNPGAYLVETLHSLLDQTFTDWHALVVDDGSSEDLSWAQSIDPRVQLIRQENAGVSAARNRGIAAGGAPLVAFLDADDLWLPSKLERQLAAMRDGLVLTSTAFEIIDGSGARRGGGYEGFASSHRELLQGNGICTSTVMTRRPILERAGLFEPGVVHGEDWDLWIRIAAIGRLEKIEETLARYRIHDANQSSDYLSYYRESNRLLARHRDGVDGEYVPRGQRRVRQVAGAQAFDAFRSTRRLHHLAWAARLNPGYTARSIAGRALRRH